MISESKREYNRKYYLANQAKLCLDQRLYREVNKEKVIAADRARNKSEARKAWRVEHDRNRLPLIRDIKREYNKQYLKSHKDEILAYRKEYYAKNKYRLNAKKMAYDKAHPEKKREWQRRWNSKNRGKLSAIENRRRSREACPPEIRPLITRFYDSIRSMPFVKCYYCGKKISGKNVHVDHVIALAKGGNHAVENLAASCATCNQSKNAKLPHEWSKHPQMFFTL